jgi:hypothetical protein
VMGKGSQLGGHLAARLGEGKAEKVGEMREKYCPAEATIQVAPNRRGAWGPH